MIYSVVFRYLDAGREQAERSGPARDLPECSAFVRAFVLNSGLGAGEWIAGEVYAGDELVARLAYNGRAIV